MCTICLQPTNSTLSHQVQTYLELGVLYNTENYTIPFFLCFNTNSTLMPTLSQPPPHPVGQKSLDLHLSPRQPLLSIPPCQHHKLIPLLVPPGSGRLTREHQVGHDLEPTQRQPDISNPPQPLTRDAALLAYPPDARLAGDH